MSKTMSARTIEQLSDDELCRKIGEQLQHRHGSVLDAVCIAILWDEYHERMDHGGLVCANCGGSLTVDHNGMVHGHHPAC